MGRAQLAAHYGDPSGHAAALEAFITQVLTTPTGAVFVPSRTRRWSA